VVSVSENGGTGAVAAAQLEINSKGTIPDPLSAMCLLYRLIRSVEIERCQDALLLHTEPEGARYSLRRHAHFHPQFFAGRAA
jgi:hypothetical protein